MVFYFGFLFFTEVLFEKSFQSEKKTHSVQLITGLQAVQSLKNESACRKYL